MNTRFIGNGRKLKMTHTTVLLTIKTIAFVALPKSLSVTVRGGRLLVVKVIVISVIFVMFLFNFFAKKYERTHCFNVRYMITYTRR